MSEEVENIFVDKELLQMIIDVHDHDRATKIETKLKHIEIKVGVVLWIVGVFMAFIITTFSVLLASIIGK